MQKTNKMIKESTGIAIISGERNITFSELLQRIALYSRKSPMKVGERILIFSENREGWIYAFYSVWANHGIAVPVDASSTVSDVAYIINDCNPVCVWTSREKMEVMKAAIKETGKPVDIHLIDDYETAETDGTKAEITYKEEDTALIIYTSGTTGSPKGVMLSFQNILVNIRAVSEEVPIFTPERRHARASHTHSVAPASCAALGGNSRDATLCGWRCGHLSVDVRPRHHGHHTERQDCHHDWCPPTLADALWRHQEED